MHSVTVTDRQTDRQKNGRRDDRMAIVYDRLKIDQQGRFGLLYEKTQTNK